jgi:hypothetical protein
MYRRRLGMGLECRYAEKCPLPPDPRMRILHLPTHGILAIYESTSQSISDICGYINWDAWLRNTP